MKDPHKSIFGKIISLFVAVLMLCSLTALMSSCSPAAPIKSKKGELDEVGKVGDYTVYYEELRYITVNSKRDMEAIYGKKIWDNELETEKYRSELQERVFSGIASDYYAVLRLADISYDGGSAAILADKSIKDEIQKQIDETVEEAGGRKQYKEGLAELAMTDHLFRFYTSVELCANEMFFVIRDLGGIDDSDQYAKDYMNSEKFIRTNHIYLEGLTDENAKLADRLANQLKASTNRESELILLKGRYCADWKMTTTHGNYYAKGNSGCGENYESAAFALSENEVSDVIKEDTGYYIILRLPKEESYMNENFDEFKTQIMGTDFNNGIARLKAELSFTPNEYCKSLDLAAIK